MLLGGRGGKGGRVLTKDTTHAYLSIHACPPPPMRVPLPLHVPSPMHVPLPPCMSPSPMHVPLPPCMSHGGRTCRGRDMHEGGEHAWGRGHAWGEDM